MWRLYTNRVHWSSDYTARTSFPFFFFFSLLALLLLQPVWESMHSGFVKKEGAALCMLARARPPVCCPLLFRGERRLWNVTQFSNAEPIGGENFRVPVGAPRCNSASVGRTDWLSKKSTHTNTHEHTHSSVRGMSVWMFWLSTLCQVLHRDVKLCAAVS